VAAKRRRPAWALLLVRYGIGGVLVVAGIAMLIIDPGGFGVDGFALAAGAGLSILMLNLLFRLGVSGDQERDREAQARRYLQEHGEWPPDFRTRGLFDRGSERGSR
jgi:hypothetical protein